MPIRSSPRPQQSRALCGFVHNDTKAAHWAQSTPSNSLGIHANHNTSMVETHKPYRLMRVHWCSVVDTAIVGLRVTLGGSVVNSEGVNHEREENRDGDDGR